MAQHDDWNEEDLLEALVADGDDDAVFIADFEAAASEVVQQDEDLAAAFSTYMEARRRLSEKYRSRGFWPISKGKSKGKGRFKGKGPWNNGRKTLQQRILESNCRLCGKKGHWRNECPMKSQGSSTVSSSAAVTVSLASNARSSDDCMPEEFMDLPEVFEHPPQDILSNASCFVQSVFSDRPATMHPSIHKPDSNMGALREKIRNHIKGNKGSNFGVQALVHRIEMKLHKQAKNSNLPSEALHQSQRILRPERKPLDRVVAKVFPGCSKAATPSNYAPVEGPMQTTASAEAETCFATHDTWGIVDTGATKTVMGSSHVKEFLAGLPPNVRNCVRRSSSNVVFRFGNRGTLKANHAMVVPVCGMWLKISVVEGSTPFLISNTLLRALGAMVDTANHQLVIPKHQTQIPLQLSPKGLYLIDMNKLFAISAVPGNAEVAAETYAQDDHDSGQNEAPNQPELKPPARSNAILPHAVEGIQVTNQGEVQSQTNTEITIGSPVIHRIDSADPNNQKFCAQDCDASAQSNAPIVQHGKLCPETGQSSVLSASCRGGIHRAPDDGGPERRVDDVRKSPHRQALRGSLGQPSGLGALVCSPLLQQQQDGASQDDQVHPPQDRRDREHRGTHTDASGQGKEPSENTGSTSQGDASHHNPKNMASGVRDRLLRSDERDSLDCRRRSPRRDERPSGQDVEHGECHAEADRADVPEHHGGRPPDAHGHPRNCNSRMGRSLEQLIDDYGCSDWALKAGEIDSFCHSLPNNHQAKFWEHVEMIEAE